MFRCQVGSAYDWDREVVAARSMKSLFSVSQDWHPDEFLKSLCPT